MTFTFKQGRLVKNICILVILLDVFFVADKHNVLGLFIAIPATIVMVYVYFHEEGE